MLFRKTFKILPKKEWDKVPDEAIFLDEIPRFANRSVKLYSATEIQKYLDNDELFVLLCFDPKKIHSFGCGFDGIQTFKGTKISIDCIERVIQLPIAEQGLSKLPPVYDSVYLGQELDDLVESMPTVPDAKTIGLIIPEMLERVAHPKVDTFDALKCFNEALTRLPYYEKLADDCKEKLDGWFVNNWIHNSEEFYDLMASLVSDDFPRTSELYFDTRNVTNEKVMEIIRESAGEMK